jgi:hypothetical protein
MSYGILSHVIFRFVFSGRFFGETIMSEFGTVSSVFGACNDELNDKQALVVLSHKEAAEAGSRWKSAKYALRQKAISPLGLGTSTAIVFSLAASFIVPPLAPFVAAVIGTAAVVKAHTSYKNKFSELRLVADQIIETGLRPIGEVPGLFPAIPKKDIEARKKVPLVQSSLSKTGTLEHEGLDAMLGYPETISWEFDTSRFAALKSVFGAYRNELNDKQALVTLSHKEAAEAGSRWKSKKYALIHKASFPLTFGAVSAVYFSIVEPIIVMHPIIAMPFGPIAIAVVGTAAVVTAYTNYRNKFDELRLVADQIVETGLRPIKEVPGLLPAVPRNDIEARKQVPLVRHTNP